MMANMDPEITDLINNGGRRTAQGKKKNQNNANAAAQLLVEFNQLQAENQDGSQHQTYPMQPAFNNCEQPATQQYLTEYSI